MTNTMTERDTALEMFRERPGDFDLVMTDYSMPRMNGLDLARAIHQIRPEVPILLSTGFAEEFAQESLEPSGIRQVLNKPLGMQDLAVALRAVLNP